MSWDWTGVAKNVGAMGLEFIGNTLLGPTGGQLGGQLAKSLGLKDDATPDEVAQALSTASPEQIVELKRIEADLAKAKLQHDQEMSRIVSGETTTALTTVNTTMQEETKQGHPWSGAWRPFWGFASAVAFFVAVVGIFILAWKAIKTGDEKLLGMIPTLVGQLGMLFAVPGAILGVASWHRGQMQRIQAGETKPSLLGALGNMVKR